MLRMRDVVITDRLRLRELEPDDCEALLEVLGDPVAMRYCPAPFDRDGFAAWIEWALDLGVTVAPTLENKTSCCMPTKGRDEWVAAARRLA